MFGSRNKPNLHERSKFMDGLPFETNNEGPNIYVSGLLVIGVKYWNENGDNWYLLMEINTRLGNCHICMDS